MASRLLLALLTALLLAVQARAHTIPHVEVPLLEQKTGAIFLAGGALDESNRELWSAFYYHARMASGKPKPRLAVFGSARPSLAKAREAFEKDEPGHLSYRHLFVAYGFEPVFVPIAIDNYRQASSETENAALVEGADAVWFGGGAQDLHARCLLKDDGTDTPVMQAVRRVFQRGGLIGGTSAGAAIMDEFTYGAGTSREYLFQNALTRLPLSAISPATGLESRSAAGSYTQGFGFVTPLDAAVDTHTDARGRYGRVLVAMQALDYQRGFAIAEDTALLIKENQGRVYGSGRVFVADARRARISSSPPFTATGLIVSVLSAFDTIDFASGEVRSPRPLLAPGVPPGAVPADRVSLVPASDLLEKDTFLDLMEALAASPRPEASATVRDEKRGELTFRFYKTPYTRGYADPTGKRVTVGGMGLEVSTSSW